MPNEIRHLPKRFNVLSGFEEVLKTHSLQPCCRYGIDYGHSVGCIGINADGLQRRGQNCFNLDYFLIWALIAGLVQRCLLTMEEAGMASWEARQ